MGFCYGKRGLAGRLARVGRGLTKTFVFEKGFLIEAVGLRRDLAQARVWVQRLKKSLSVEKEGAPAADARELRCPLNAGCRLDVRVPSETGSG